jgi:hypothetical protein
VPGRRDKPRQVREILATLSVGQRVTISFRGGPLAGVVLDSRSAHESERWDVAWLIVKTHGGQLGAWFSATDRLRSQSSRASPGHYEIQSRAENTEERRLFLIYYPPLGVGGDRPAE